MKWSKLKAFLYSSGLRISSTIRTIKRNDFVSLKGTENISRCWKLGLGNFCFHGKCLLSFPKCYISNGLISFLSSASRMSYVLPSC